MIKNRLLHLLMAFLVLFPTVFMYSVPKAHAIVPAAAVPIGIEVGVGAYVTTGLAIATVAGLLGYDHYSDQVHSDMVKTWNGAQQTIKDSLRAAYTTAVTTGSKVMTIPSDVMGFVRNEVVSRLPRAYPDTVSPLLSAAIANWSGKVNYYYSSGFYVYPITTNTGYWFYDTATGHYTNTFSVIDDGSSSFRFKMQGQSETQKVTLPFTGVVTTVYVLKSLITGLNGANTFVSDEFNLMLDNVPQIVLLSDAQINALKGSLVTQAINALPSTGVTVAVPNLGDVVAHPAGNDSIDLGWDQANQKYVYPGGSVYTGVPDFAFPLPNIGENQKVSVPIGGVQTDIRTGEAIDGGVVNPPVEVPTGFWDTLIGWITGFWDKFVELMKSLFIPTAIDFSPIQNIWVNKFPAIDAITSALASLTTVTANTDPPKYKWKIGDQENTIIDFSKVDPTWITLAKTAMRIGLWGGIVFMILRELRPKPTIG